LHRLPPNDDKKLEVGDYINIREKAAELGCAIPEGVVLLPFSFERAKDRKDLVYADSADTVKKLLTQAGVPALKIDRDGEHYSRAVYHSLEWIGPLILITAAAYTQDPNVISVTLNVLSNYLTDWFRGVPKENRKATLTFVKEMKDGAYKRLDYSGPPENLKDVKDILDRLDNEKTD
jgi:hypothetical protein